MTTTVRITPRAIRNTRATNVTIKHFHLTPIQTTRGCFYSSRVKCIVYFVMFARGFRLRNKIPIAPLDLKRFTVSNTT